MHPRLLLVCLAASCTPEFELDRWRGQHLDYDTATPLQVCAGTHAYMDGFIPFVAGELGIDDLSERPRYRWLTHEQYIEEDNEGHSGITYGTMALAQDPTLIHELVHAVMNATLGDSLPFFKEGIATAYSRQPGPADPRYPTTLFDPRDAMLMSPDSGLNYGAARSFVVFLLAHYGPEPFREFYPRVRGAQTLAVIEQEFLAIYGEELGVAVERFLERAPCSGVEFVVISYDCTAPEVQWSPTGWIHETTLDCDKDDVYGGINDENPPVNATSVTLEVPETGSYLLQTSGDAAASIRLGPCFGCPWDVPDHVVTAGDSSLVPLEPGTYYVRVEASGTLETSTRVELLRF